MATRKKNVKAQHAVKVLSSLDNLRAWGWICDFEIRVGREMFSVHRTVLAACSEYFQKLFTRGSREAQQGFVEIVDSNVRAIRICIEFMYTGEAEITIENVEHLLPAAGLLKLADLAELCLDFLKENLTHENCLYIRRLCLEYHCVKIEENVLRFITDNMADIVSTEGFLGLRKEEILYYLKSPQLSHETIWKAVVNWVKSSLNDRKKDFFDLMSPNFVRFPPGFLLDTVWNEQLVRQSRPVKDMLIVVLFSNVEALKESITVENCYLIKELCDGSHMRDRVAIYNETKIFMMRHFEKIAAKPEFCDMSKDDLFQIFHSPKTKYSTEIVKWEAALKWINHDLPMRRKFFPELFRLIKLENLPLVFINDVVRADPLTKGCSACTELIMDALVSHASPSEDAATPSKRARQGGNDEKAGKSMQSTTPKTKRTGMQETSPMEVGSKSKEQGGSKTGPSGISKKTPRKLATPKKAKQKDDESEAIPIMVEDIPREYIAVLYRESNYIKVFDLEKKWSLLTKLKNSQEEFFRIVSYQKNLYLLNGSSLFHFENKAWKELASMKQKPTKEAKPVTFRDSIHVIDNSAIAWYIPAANKWVEELQQGRFGEGFCVTSTDDFIYILGGNINSNRAVRRSLDGNEEIAPMVKGRVGAAAASIGGVVFVLGGVLDVTKTDGAKTDSTERYDPRTNSWTYIKQMQCPRAFFCACVVEDKIYAVGGNSTPVNFDSVEVYEKEKGAFRWRILHQMMRAKPPFSAAVILATLPSFS